MQVKNGVIVVGGGVMGAATAYWLARKGRSVVLFDQFDVPNQWGASGDHLRVFRLTYGKDAFYTDMALKALPLWLELNAESGEKLLNQNGMLELSTQANSYEEQSMKVLKDMKVPFDVLDKSEIKRHYPMINTRALRFGLFHKDGGMIWAMRAVSALLNVAQRKGAKLRSQTKIASVLWAKDGIKGVKDSTGKIWQADDYVFAPGAWTVELLKRYGIPLQVTRQDQIYFRPPHNRGRYRPEHFPVFAALTRGFYGFPMHIHGFMKMGDHRPGSKGFPSPAANHEVSAKFEKKCRAFLKEFIPDLAEFTEMEGKACYYTSTKDKDFIIDRLPDAPNGYVAAGFSGHGFKFAPLIGKTVAELVCGAKPDLNLHRFRLARFKLKKV